MINKKIKNGDGYGSKDGVHSESEKLFFEKRIAPVWISTKAAAALLSISPNALRIRKCRGQIEHRYLGKRLRFDESVIQSLIVPPGTYNERD